MSMFNLIQESSQALRALLRSPAFTMPIILILGLGLGANLALHTLLQNALGRHLPLPSRAQVMLAKAQIKGEGSLWLLSNPQVQDLKACPGPFAGRVEVYGDQSGTLSVNERKVPVAMPMVGEGWFGMLGLQPSHGRTFTQEEERTGALVAVLSHRLWRTTFLTDPTIVGSTIKVNDAPPVTVVGIGPEGFEGLELGSREDLWMPLKALPTISGQLQPDFMTSRQLPVFTLHARLRPGVEIREAQAALDAAGAVMAQNYPASDGGKRIVLEGLEASEQKVLGRILPQRTLLLVAAGLALALALVGTSGLFAARAARRERELALRSALGADTVSLARHQGMEALLLALLTAPVALGTGLVLARRLALAPGQAAANAPLWPSLDGRLLAMGLGLSLLAFALAAIVPILKTRHLDSTRVLAAKGSMGRTSGAGRFVAAQVALSLALMVASSVALGAFRSAARMGYPAARRAVMILDTGDDARLPQRLLARLRVMPEVVSAAQSTAAPLGGMRIIFGLRGGERTEMEHVPAAMVGDNWFKTLGAPLLEGRDFTENDGTQAAILNESLARRFFPGESALGRSIDMGSDKPLKVVGVVADHRMRRDPDFHLPMIWMSMAWMKSNQTSVLVEGRMSGKVLLALMQQALEQEKPGSTPILLRTLEDHVAATLYRENQNLRLLGSLGLGSLLLACFGLWAALNLQVALRHRELGIRAALGANARHLAVRILDLGLRLHLAGLCGGGLLVYLLSRLSTNRWPGLPPITLLDVATAAATLTAAALLACLLPALRAARIQPAEALRSE